jgi:Holliday junction resolvasome RuvABC endonuclease subunit
LLGLDEAPEPHDAADALAVAICHVHSVGSGPARAAIEHAAAGKRVAKTWREYRP